MDTRFGMLLSLAGSLQLIESRAYMSLICFVSIITVLLSCHVRDRNRLSKYPLIRENSLQDISGTNTKECITVNTSDLVERGFKQVCIPHC